MSLFVHQQAILDRFTPLRVTGRVVEVTGLTVVATGLGVPVGSICEIEPQCAPSVEAQVVGFRGSQTLLLPLREAQGVAYGDNVSSAPARQFVGVGHQLLGRVVDGMGRIIDGRPTIHPEAHYPVFVDPPSPLDRVAIEKPLATGIRAIDLLNTVGGGQRLGIFSGTGVGKSVLLGMIARNTAADIRIVALVGERGREVVDFLRKEIGERAWSRTVMVVSTSDESPVLRVRAGFVATAIAEYFRDQGNDVLLLMDSTTRMAMAQRQIGLAAGEPPATKGYPPSVFALLPRLLERAGRTRLGSITGMYSVLVEGDDLQDPIADAVRGILDGHLWLSRDLANRGHYPAVAPLESISRLMVDVVDDRHSAAARDIRSVLAVWSDIEDLVNIGAYAKGSNVDYDLAVDMKPRIDELLRQAMDDCATWEDSRSRLFSLHDEIGACRDRLHRGVR